MSNNLALVLIFVKLFSFCQITDTIFSAGLQDASWFHDKIIVSTPSSLLLPYSECLDIPDGWRCVFMQLYPS